MLLDPRLVVYIFNLTEIKPLFFISFQYLLYKICKHVCVLLIALVIEMQIYIYEDIFRCTNAAYNLCIQCGSIFKNETQSTFNFSLFTR